MLPRHSALPIFNSLVQKFWTHENQVIHCLCCNRCWVCTLVGKYTIILRVRGVKCSTGGFYACDKLACERHSFQNDFGMNEIVKKIIISSSDRSKITLLTRKTMAPSSTLSLALRWLCKKGGGVLTMLRGWCSYASLRSRSSAVRFSRKRAWDKVRVKAHDESNTKPVRFDERRGG